MEKRFLKDGDVIAGAAVAALGVYITLTASKWDIMGPEGPGPGFFPIGYGVALVGLSLALIVSRLRSGDAVEKKSFDWAGFGRAMMTWSAFAVCAGLMNTLGFYISFALMTFFLVRFVFGRTLASAAITSVSSALGFYLVFGFALDVSLPIGVLGF
jgi:putative tricarboxylic transport membrane protein